MKKKHMKHLKSILYICVGSLFYLSSGWATIDLQTKEWRTKEGMHVIYRANSNVPSLHVNLAFAAGSAYDGKQFGLSQLTTRLLDQGNNGLHATDVAEQLENVGAQLATDVSRDMVVIELKTLTEPAVLASAFDTFTMIVNHPDFPSEAFEREKKQQLLSIKQTLESPSEISDQLFYRTLYQQHPYAHPIMGTRATLTSIGLTDVRTFYHRYFVASNAILVLTGAIDETTAHQLAAKISKEMPPGRPAPSISKATPPKEEMNVEIPFTATQTVVRMGQLGINHHNPDYFPLLVGNYILGGGMLSELSDALREKRGLTYGIYSQMIPMPGDGPFIIKFSTQNQQKNLAIRLTRDILDKFVKEGPSDKSLSAAKEYLDGNFYVTFSNDDAITNLLLRIAFFDLPKDFIRTYSTNIRAVTAMEIKKAFQRNIASDHLIQVTTGSV